MFRGALCSEVLVEAFALINGVEIKEKIQVRTFSCILHLVIHAGGKHD